MFIKMRQTHIISSHYWLVQHCTSLVTLRAKLSGAVYCNRPCLSVFVCGSVTTITRNCVHRSSPKWVCR